MSARLKGFDYTSPFYYMVTLRRLDGFAPLSAIDEHGVVDNAITKAFHKVIKCFHLRWYVIKPIWCYVIMPDHIHLIIKLTADARKKRSTLVRLVLQLKQALSEAYYATLAGQSATNQGVPVSLVTQGRYAAPIKKADLIFDPEWHEWIVKRKGQMNAFVTYIQENPARSWLRKTHRTYFHCINEIEFLGRKWYGYGNTALLELPVIEPFRCSRQWPENGDEWRAAIACAQRISPGCAGISTFMSPCEKACGNEIGKAGGRWIVLSPEGFGERGHPSRHYEKLCADGRMLFLSLWPARTHKLAPAELYQRCHEMGDLVMKALAQLGGLAGVAL